MEELDKLVEKCLKKGRVFAKKSYMGHYCNLGSPDADVMCQFRNKDILHRYEQRNKYGIPVQDVFCDCGYKS